MRRKLELSHDDWHALAKLCDSKRAVVAVPRVLLETLLRDHSLLLQIHKGDVVE